MPSMSGSSSAPIAPGLRAIAVNGTTSAGLTVFETLVRAAYFIAITRLVGPDGYGLWTYAIALYGLALSAVTLGFETLVPNAYGPGREAGDRFASSALALRIAACLGAGVVMVLYALAAVPDGTMQLAVAMAVPALVFRGSALVLRTAFAGRHEVARSAAPILACRLAELVAGLALILGGAGILALLALHALCWGIELALLWRGLAGGAQWRVRLPARAETAEAIRRSIPVTLLDLSNGFVISAAVVLYQPFATGLAEVGQIGVAVQLASFLLTAGFAFLGTASPVLARALDRNDPRLPRYGWLVALGCAAITALVVGLFHLLSQPLFLAVLGDRYELARQLTLVTLVGAGLMLLPHGFAQLMILQQRLGGLLCANALACLTVLALFFQPGAAMDPLGAVEAVAIAWGVRALVITVLGTMHAASFSRSLRTG